MVDVVIRAPGREKPGYLRRMRRAMEIQERAQGGLTVALLDQMIDFVLSEAEVEAPEGVDVRAALLDLSKDEWDSLFRAATGGDDSVNPPNGA